MTNEGASVIHGNTVHAPTPHALFFCGKLCESIRPTPMGRQPSVARDEGPYSGSHIQYAVPINAKFGFSHWMKSPSVGLTFPVSCTFCL
jgi:hypothetical protein